MGSPWGAQPSPPRAAPASSKLLWLLAWSQLGHGGCGEGACPPAPGTMPLPVPALRTTLTQPEEPYLAPVLSPSRRVTTMGSPPLWPGPTPTASSPPWWPLPSGQPRLTLSNNTRGSWRERCLAGSVLAGRPIGMGVGEPRGALLLAWACECAHGCGEKPWLWHMVSWAVVSHLPRVLRVLEFVFARGRALGTLEPSLCVYTCSEAMWIHLQHVFVFFLLTLERGGERVTERQRQRNIDVREKETPIGCLQHMP